MSSKTIQTFENDIDILIEAVGSDINSLDSSVEKAELDNIFTGLQNVRALLFVFDDITKLEQATRKSYPHSLTEDPGLRETLLVMKALVPLFEKGHITDKDIEAIPKKVGIVGLEASIYFLTGLSELIRKIPAGRFSNEQTKNSLREAIQKCLDNFIERELEEEEDIEFEE